MRVLVFGASSTQGYWDSQGGWADRLKHYYDSLQMRDFSIDRPAVMNLGISDDTAADVLRRIEPEASARQNDKGLAFIIQIGANNAAEENGQLRTTPKQYESELMKIIENAKKFSTKILVVGFAAVDEAKTNPIPWANLSYKNENILKFQNAAQIVCQEIGIPFIPLLDKFRQAARSGEYLHAHDGLHPNDAGHQLIFEQVHRAMDEILNT